MYAAKASWAIWLADKAAGSLHTQWKRFYCTINARSHWHTHTYTQTHTHVNYQQYINPQTPTLKPCLDSQTGRWNGKKPSTCSHFANRMSILVLCSKYKNTHTHARAHTHRHSAYTGKIPILLTRQHQLSVWGHWGGCNGRAQKQ